MDAIASKSAKPETQPSQVEKDRFEQLLEISPRAAVQDTRREMERVLGLQANAHGLRVNRPSFLTLTRALRKQGIIDEATAGLLDYLRTIGNNAAHEDADISPQEARRYRELVVEVWARLL